jgi:hypothetical protein
MQVMQAKPGVGVLNAVNAITAAELRLFPRVRTTTQPQIMAFVEQ